jgi:predicted membrane channel-forming protein YqfA (hemolysin III family)
MAHAALGLLGVSSSSLIRPTWADGQWVLFISIYTTGALNVLIAHWLYHVGNYPVLRASKFNEPAADSMSESEKSGQVTKE